MSLIYLILNNTISPDKDYYFRFSYPCELNKAALGVKIALFSNYDDTLIYYNSKIYAHELNDPAYLNQKRSIRVSGSNRLPKHDKKIFVTWAYQGDMLYFLEYIPSYSFAGQVEINNLFINMVDRYFLRVNDSDLSEEAIVKLKIRKENFDTNEVLQLLKSQNLFNPQPLETEHKPLSFFTNNFLKKNKWYL